MYAVDYGYIQYKFEQRDIDKINNTLLKSADLCYL